MKLLQFTVFLFFIAACTNKEDNKRDQLSGMYKLLTIEYQDSSNVWLQSKWSKDGTGYIIYDGAGHMAVQITPKDYKDFKWLAEETTINTDSLMANVDTMAIPELKKALVQFASNYVYVGTYIINDTAGTVTHHLLSATVPSIWNTDKERQFFINGDTVTLKVKGVNRRLRWLKQA